jgi:hypothetical protein
MVAGQERMSPIVRMLLLVNFWTGFEVIFSSALREWLHPQNLIN